MTADKNNEIEEAEASEIIKVKSFYVWKKCYG